MSSIWSSLSGIRAHQFMLDVVGNNLANADTTGFKSSQVTFSDMMSQTLRSATAGSATLGGTNPVQVGLGVQVGTVTRDFGQGRLQETGNPLDLAIDGKGFFVLNDGTRSVYSRSATFSIDADSYLVEAVTGYRMMDITNEPVQIEFNDQIPAQKTSTVTLAGNLATAAEVPQREILATITPLTVGGAVATAASGLNALDGLTTAYADGDTITVTATDSTGETMAPITFTYGAANDGTTLGDLVDQINAAYAGEATAAIDASGNITLTASEEGEASYSLSIADGSGTGSMEWSAHEFYVQNDGTEGGTHNVSANIYDSRGNAHILTMSFQRVTEREWSMTATMNDESGTFTKGTIDGIRFNTDGSFNSISGGVGAGDLIIDFGGASNTQTVHVAIGSASKFDGLTLFGGASTAAATGQDGFAPGTLKSFTIGRDGIIQGLYTNGERRDLAQMQMATFDNPEGLESMGNGIWGATINSGDAIIGTALTGRAGAVVGSVLEGSNVESAEELTKLIIAQHGFQMSTRALAVSSRIIQELATAI